MAVVEATLSGPGLDLRASLIPWDTRALGFPVAQVDRIELLPGGDPKPSIERFVSWLDAERVRLVSCRLDSLRLRESMLLEDLGFRFVEMVYSPALEPLPTDLPPDIEVAIATATADDGPALRAMASSVFATGRHVIDHRLDPNAGHHRYRGWLDGAMTDDAQEVLTALIRGDLVGFFVIEHRDGHVYWHLTAIAPQAQGQGLGKRIWRQMVSRHQSEGVFRIETTISAHNAPVINLYAGLGFRFTAPRSTFHWLR